jgi:hypothetical protein
MSAYIMEAMIEGIKIFNKYNITGIRSYNSELWFMISEKEDNSITHKDKHMLEKIGWRHNLGPLGWYIILSQ